MLRQVEPESPEKYKSFEIAAIFSPVLFIAMEFHPRDVRVMGEPP